MALNKAIKFAPFGRRTLLTSRRLWQRYRAEESSAYLSGWKSPSGKG